MGKQRPLVSVIMPAYNAEQYIKEAIQSILHQTYKRWELIIVNDASTDKTGKIIGAFRRHNPRRIKVVSLKKQLNAGGDSCANVALGLARGTYIARMDADDVAHPQRLEKQVNYLESHPEMFMVGSQAKVIDSQSNIIGFKHEPLTNDAIKQSYFTFNPLIHPTIMMRSSFENHQPFRYKIEYSANNDFFTFFKLHCQGAEFANLPDYLLSLRIHSTNDTLNNIKQKLANTLRIRMRMVLYYDYTPTVKGIFATLAQTTIMLLLPEKVIKNLYFFTKGIMKTSPALMTQSAKTSIISSLSSFTRSHFRFPIKLRYN